MAKKFWPGQGLRKNSQGILHPIQLPTHKGKASLGYTGGSKQRNLYKKILLQLSGVLMSKVKNPPPNPTDQDGDEEILILPLEEKAKIDSFLLEVNQKVKEEINTRLQKV